MNQHDAYSAACEQYAALGVDVASALEQLARVHISLHCWQGDDVGGFERSEASAPGGGLQVTGNFPGKARNVAELRSDLEQAFRLIPGKHRLNLHAMYGEFGGKPVDRDAVGPEHFAGWVEWAKANGLALDFNATCFAHPLAASGFTLSHPDDGIRAFWVEHVKRCRGIASWMGRELQTRCIHNLWIPDGSKDHPVDRLAYRQRLDGSLADAFETAWPGDCMADSVESKLFGIGSEAFVVGSHEFYLAWALRHGTMVCLDMGHFHPTESVADKVSALLPFMPELLLHVSRGVRWDSDHVVTLNDDLRAVAHEVVRAGALGRVNFALDYFDAEMNRVGAWIIGARATMQALLGALLEPTDRLRQYEREGKLFERLALLEHVKALPFGAVWDHYCDERSVPSGESWIGEVQAYARAVQSSRG